MRWHGFLAGWLIGLALSLTVTLAFDLDAGWAFGIAALVTSVSCNLGMALERPR